MQEGLCPSCHNHMAQSQPQHYYCQHCNQQYVEQYYCPNCEQQLQQIKGCGAINYICTKDGLVSSRKVQFHYLSE